MDRYYLYPFQHSLATAGHAVMLGGQQLAYHFGLAGVETFGWGQDMVRLPSERLKLYNQRKNNQTLTYRHPLHHAAWNSKPVVRVLLGCVRPGGSSNSALPSLENVVKCVYWVPLYSALISLLFGVNRVETTWGVNKHFGWWRRPWDTGLHAFCADSCAD